MAIYLIYACAVMAFMAAAMYARKVMAVRIDANGGASETVVRFEEISTAIRQGAMAFLSREYRYIAGFALVFALLMALLLNEEASSIPQGVFSAGAFLAGAFTSSLCAFLGMKIATLGNVRTTVMAQRGIAPAFRVAFESGAVFGFALVGLTLSALISVYLAYGQFIPDQRVLMDVIASFGLGGSTVALFGRVGGGIYTKAADLGADVVGKIEHGIPEDDARNPAVIADNVGDNVGDVAGMGADLFGSCAEATCAALLIGATVPKLVDNQSALLYPVLVVAIGVPVSIVTSLFARLGADAIAVETVLKRQILLSTILMSVAVYFLTQHVMIDTFELSGRVVTRNGVLASVLGGLWSGLLIGYVTEYYTSHAYGPVRAIANAARTGPATNIIYGLSLGYESAVVPVVALALTTYLSFHLVGMYGIAMAAIGMISTIAIGLTIDAYGPVSDNAGGIAQMAHLGPEIRRRTDVLDAAGNTTAAIGKGFAIGSAVLTGLALFAAFLTRSKIDALDMLSPLVFTGLLVGGVLPFLFTAQTMRAVAKAALAMVEEVRHQFQTIPGILEGHTPPDYRRCVAISASAALRQMFAPAFVVIVTPLAVGTLFGARALAGVLAGALVSGLVMALSSSNAGGGWDNAKKFIESGEHGGKGSDSHKAAVVGDTVGDPFKDTSGPSLNILMKLMAILSLVFAPFFAQHGGILLKLLKLE